jgi:hypothetical protein
VCVTVNLDFVHPPLHGKLIAGLATQAIHREAGTSPP